MAVSPITGELVPLAQMAEHMRISLIDPQWRTQREAMLSKIRETTQASDDEITRNLVDLAGHRPDVFGTPRLTHSAFVRIWICLEFYGTVESVSMLKKGNFIDSLPEKKTQNCISSRMEGEGESSFVTR